MKKCASCTKDLPDAALHCVFCGARQAPAPAVQQGMAKTAFGYSANDVIDQMKPQSGPRPMAQPQAPAYNPPPPAYNPPFQPPQQFQPPQPAFQPPRPAPQPPMATPPRPPPAMAPPYPQAGQPPPGGFMPPSAASAKTMFVPGPGQPPMQPGMQPGMQPTLLPPPQPNYGRPAGPAMAPTLIPSAPPMQHSPMMAIPQAQPPPYYGSQTSKIMRPIEPWRDSMRVLMLWWGVALLIAFATPLRTSPDLLFNWKQVIDGEGTAKLPPLIIAAVGLLSLIVAGIPMQSAPRGFIAAVLGLAGIAVPIALVGMPPWQSLTSMIGVILLIPGLLVRAEYRSATFPRLLVTLGAIGVLLPFLLPQNGAIPLVSVFKGLIDLPGSAKIGPALALGLVTIVVMSLLAWLPAPVTGAATLWAWLLILWALIVHATVLLVSGSIGAAVTSSPNAALVPWIAGGAAGSAGFALGSAYLVLVGYGLASVLGKQLE